MPPFSHRQNFISNKITIREDAPENLRYFVLETAKASFGWSEFSLLSLLCLVLRVTPDATPRSILIREELNQLMYGCEWFKVYDFIEALHARFLENYNEEYQTEAARFAGRTQHLFH